MEPVGSEAAVPSPWSIPQFLTEEGLRAAQEYYFQTHGKQSKLIAQARAAQGLAKSFMRRKLARELGEDFKLYTGTQLGETAAPEDMASLGIRGELNALLKHIYTRIAPNQPIISPIQEDLTILKHPHGALEVCYAMVFYYGSLMQQYASFATNRRKMLKSVMDEELFKWIWRLVIGFMMQPEEVKLSQEPSYLSAGLSFIPIEQQRVPLGAKLYEVGMFLLSQTMQESHLRMALCYYYSVYLRQMQTLLAQHTARLDLDAAYSFVTRHVEGDIPDQPLVAIDVLFNSKGNSMESFDDVLKDEDQLSEYIPDGEFAFINQFEDFGNPKRLATSLRKLIPDPRRDAIEGQESSLMPLLLTLRVMPLSLREPVLAGLPVPLLNLLRNRITNTERDTVATELAAAIHETMNQRRGESYTVNAPAGHSKGAVATSVRVAPPAGKVRGQSASLSPAAARAAARRQVAVEMRAAEAAAQKAREARAAGAGLAQAAEPAADVSAPVPQASPAAAPEPVARPQPARRPAPAEPARPEAAATAPKLGYLDDPVLLAWRLDGGRIAGISITARELFTLVGGDARFLVAWVVFSLRTGQVFGLEPSQVSKERVEQIYQAMRRQAGERAGVLSGEQLARAAHKAQGASHARLLLSLLRESNLQRYMYLPEPLEPALGHLSSRFGAGLLDFLRNPSDESFRQQRTGLSGDERKTLHILQRVARSQ